MYIPEIYIYIYIANGYCHFGSSHFGSRLLVARPINHWAILFISRSRDVYFSLQWHVQKFGNLHISCVGFARRHAAKMQLPVVKEHLTKALCLLTSNSNETILSATPSLIKPSTPSTASQMASLRTDLSAPLVAAVHQTCSVAVSDAVSGLVGQLNALLAHSDSMSHRIAQVEQRLAKQGAPLVWTAL